jgi:hypothetical protein
MNGYRFRTEGELLVLQVYVPPKSSPYDYGREGTWRDATVQDIPVADPFRREPPRDVVEMRGLDISEHFR